ncbi:MAG: S-layer homology domain-containing protein, partial [Pseudoflavonifractor sp.]
VGESLMAGKGDGSFHPNDTITYAEAVTIMMRILGYKTTDIASGATWYGGYLSTANAIGLTDGVTLSHAATISRGQTAILFENMLYLKPKGATDPYLTKLGGKLTPEAIILDLNATTDDGTTGAVAVTEGAATTTYKTGHVPFAAGLAGCRAKLVLDQHEKVIAIQPATAGTQRTVNITATPEITYLTVSGGERLEIGTDTPVYKNGEKKLYKDVYINLKAGAQLTLHYAATGKLEYIFVPPVDVAALAAVATGSGDSFASLVGGDRDYRVIKNGLPASSGDIRQYDVATYDKATKTLFVSDLRLTGIYENAKPSPVTPLEVTVLGAKLPVLSTAFDDLAGLKIGSAVTLLLTADGQVAGAVTPNEARSTTVGVVKVTGTTATVTPLADLRDTAGKPVELAGTLNMDAASAAKLQGQLVTVSSGRAGWLTVARLSSSGAAGALEVSARTLGGAPLADNVVLYERVGNGVPVRITMDQITRKTVPATQISYVGKDYAGRVDMIVFDDATGDCYSYGLARMDVVSEMNSSNASLFVEYADGKTSEPLVSGATAEKNSFIGVAASLDKVGSTSRLARWVELKAVTKVSRAAFDMKDSTAAKQEQGRNAPIGTVNLTGMVLPISGDVVCYNKTTKRWFGSLDEARAYSDSLTVYYDRAPQDGGKVRVVVVE